MNRQRASTVKKVDLKTQRTFIELWLMQDTPFAEAAKATGVTLAQAKVICRNPPRPESYKERIRREMLATPKATRQAFLDRMREGETLGTAAQAVGITDDVALATLRASLQKITVLGWTVK